MGASIMQVGDIDKLTIVTHNVDASIHPLLLYIIWFLFPDLLEGHVNNYISLT